MRRVFAVGAALLFVAGCGPSSTPASTTSTPTSTQSSAAAGGGAAAYAGTWLGPWNNTTFGTSGSVGFVVTATGNDVTWKTTVTGNAFGAAPPAPTTITGRYDPTTGLIFGSQNDPAFGTCGGTIHLDGRLTAECHNVPSPTVASVDITGSWPAAGPGDFTYKVNFKNGSPAATGRVHMTRGA